MAIMNKELTGFNQISDRTKLIPLLAFIHFFSVVNGTMFHVAIPDISAEFHLHPSDASWVITGYLIIFSIGTVTYGKLIDIFPVKNLITIGLGLFAAGSLIGFFAQWYLVLVVGRLVQALGASAAPALIMFAATRYFPSGQRGKVLGVASSTVAIGAGIGPILGGYLSSTFDWRFLFLISIMVVFAIPFLRSWLPNEIGEDGRFDTKGAILLGVGVASLLLFVSELIWWSLLVSIVMLTWFVRHIHRMDNPFIQPKLLLNKKYRNALIVCFLAIGSVYGMLFMVPLMLREFNHLDSNSIGFVMLPGAVSAAIMGRIGGRIADKKGSVRVVYSGLLLLLMGFMFFTFLTGFLPWVISLNFALCYIGFSFIHQGMANTVSQIIPPEESGVGMGMYNLVFFMAGGFSTTVVGKLLDLSSSSFSFNPFMVVDASSLYSNIFFGFIMVLLFSGGLFYETFRVGKNKSNSVNL
jgi:DHA2 family metal-tetracycline-proton antiporter-like MFS transporter